MSAYIELTEAQLAGMARRYAAGASLFDLMQDYGICQEGITRRLLQRGVTIRPPGRRKKAALAIAR